MRKSIQRSLSLPFRDSRLTFMTTPEPSAARQKIDEQVDKLDSLFTHLEKTVQDLDDVVIDGHQRIDSLSQQIQDLERRVKESPDATGDEPAS